MWDKIVTILLIQAWKSRYFFSSLYIFASLIWISRTWVRKIMLLWCVFFIYIITDTSILFQLLSWRIRSKRFQWLQGIGFQWLQGIGEEAAIGMGSFMKLMRLVLGDGCATHGEDDEFLRPCANCILIPSFWFFCAEFLLVMSLF